MTSAFIEGPVSSNAGSRQVRFYVRVAEKSTEDDLPQLAKNRLRTSGEMATRCEKSQDRIPPESVNLQLCESWNVIALALRRPESREAPQKSHCRKCGLRSAHGALMSPQAPVWGQLRVARSQMHQSVVCFPDVSLVDDKQPIHEKLCYRCVTFNFEIVHHLGTTPS